MRTIQVELKGDKILMNNPACMLQQQSRKMKTKEYDMNKEAEIRLYKTAEGKLYVPSTAVIGSLIKGASWKKKGKNALAPLIAGGCRIKAEEILLTPNEYTVDLRTVVIQRQRIMRARPKVTDWKLNFEIEYNEFMLNDEDIKDCLKDAGERVGLLDFRPANRGSFGTFVITKWKVLGEE